MEEQTAPRDRTRGRRDRARRVSPVTGTASVDGLCPELLTALALRRVLGRGVAKAGELYVDDGHPMGRYLIGTFTELIDCGLLALATEDGWGLRRVTVTDAGQARYAQMCGILRRNQR
ncbi:MAG: hypothetical protein ACRDQG_08430 [Pseudonocardiaceae bacterium]